MAIAHATRAARLSAAVDRAFGEQFRFEAMAKPDDPNARPSPDATRLMFEAVATWEGPSKATVPTARGAASDDRAHAWRASFPSITIEDRLMPWQVQDGDKVTRLLDGAVYQVLAPMPNSFGRTTILLTSRKR